MRHRTERLILILTAVLLWGPLAQVSAEPKKEDETPKYQNLMWPPPPLQPRIRYVGFITGEMDVKEKKKPSWIDRIAGRPPETEQLRLTRPYGIAVDKDGRIFVADSFRRQILIFDRQEHVAGAWSGNAQIPLSLPVGLALDSQSRLYVSDSFAAQIVLFNPDGQPVLAFGQDVLKRPAGLALDERRTRLYVSDTKLNEIFVFEVATLKLLKRFGGPSTSGNPEPGRFSAPSNLALDRRGRLYVTDTFNCRIQIFDPEGKFLRMFGTQGDRPGDFVRPKGIALDSEEHIYVIDAAFNNLQVLTSEGQPLLFVGSMGEAPGQFLLPTGIAIDDQDRIYVTEHRLTAGRLQIFQYLRQPQSSPDGKNGGK